MHQTESRLPNEGCVETPLPAPRPSGEKRPSAETLLKRYDVIRELGNSKFSRVYLAYDRELGRQTVIKYLNLNNRQDYVQRFRREARMMAAFKHPNIVQLFDFGIDEKKLYISMEYVEGVELDRFNARMAEVETEPERIRRLCEIVHEICFALEYLHNQGIVHRDIKPANILVDRNGVPYLIDFGIARRVTGQDNVTVNGELVGTVAYMSPEQADGKIDQLDRRTDIYSLGVMLYHLLTWQPPFVGASYDEVLDQIKNVNPVPPREINPEIPPALESILVRALAKDKKERYLTAVEMATDLARLSKPPKKSKPSGFYARHKIHLALAVNALAIACIGWNAFASGDGPQSEPASASDDFSDARFVMKESFESGDLGTNFATEDGEISVTPGSLVIRRGAVRSQSVQSSASDLRLDIALVPDPKATPEQVTLALFQQSGKGYAMGWNRSGDGWISLDGRTEFRFQINVPAGRPNRIALVKKGSGLTILNGEAVLAKIPSVFVAARSGSMTISSVGGTLKIESISLKVR